MSAPNLEGTRPGSRYWLAIGAITAAGAAVRLGYVHAMSPIQLGLSDSWSYWRLGQQLAAGQGYISPTALINLGEAIPTAEFPPLFPAVVALLHMLGLESVAAQKPVLACLGAISIGLIGEIGRRAASPRVGILAALFAACSPSLIESDGAFMAEVVFVPLIAATLLAALTSGDSVRRWALVGGGIGLAALARAEALLLVPLLVPGLWLRKGRARGARDLLLVGALTASAVAVVLPWTARNYAALSAFVPISGSANTALFGANNPETYRGQHKGSWIQSGFAQVDVSGMSEIERFRTYREAGLAHMRENAAALPGVMVARLARTFGFRMPVRWGRHPEARSWEWSEAAIRIGLVVLVLASFGAAMLVATPGSLLLLLAPVALACLTSMGVYGNPRFRLVAEPSLLVLAACAIALLADSIRPNRNASLPNDPA